MGKLLRLRQFRIEQPKVAVGRTLPAGVADLQRERRGRGVIAYVLRQDFIKLFQLLKSACEGLLEKRRTGYWFPATNALQLAHDYLLIVDMGRTQINRHNDLILRNCCWEILSPSQNIFRQVEVVDSDQAIYTLEMERVPFKKIEDELEKIQVVVATLDTSVTHSKK